MCELNNIQTYEIVGSDLRLTIDRFAAVLQSVDLWNDEIKKSLDAFEWKTEEGIPYASINQPGFYKSKLSEIKISPSIALYTPWFHSSFKENWMCCELFIASEDLRSFESGKYYKHTYELIKTLTYEMQKEFKQTGVYFTDEAQDGSDFDAISRSDTSKLWQFDYAIIPLSLENVYRHIPKTHVIEKRATYFESWHVKRWKE